MTQQQSCQSKCFGAIKHPSHWRVFLFFPIILRYLVYPRQTNIIGFDLREMRYITLQNINSVHGGLAPIYTT